jgi:protein involved in polysaccharide export with SLBB domain
VNSISSDFKKFNINPKREKLMYRIITLFFLLLTVSASAQDILGGAAISSGSLLTASNAISVTIGGAFVVNGTFPASQYERLDQFVTRMFNQYREQSIRAITDPRIVETMTQRMENFSRRNIVLKRMNGEKFTLDLEKFRLTGDFKQNPYLKNEDVIIFSKLDLERDFVSVDGAVNNPVKFAFMEGDRLSDALLFAQGISKAYENVTKAEIVRSSYDGQKLETTVVDINSNLPLQRADRIRVLADETSKKDFRVLVLGEVNKPGYIPISKDNTTVKNVIEQAGGFKPTASLYKTELVRGTDSYTMYKKNMLTKSFEQNKFSNEGLEGVLYDNQQMEGLRMERMSYLVEEDTAYFKIDNQLRLLRGNALVDFTKLYTDTTQANFSVKDGDVILVPQQQNLVYIYGQVGFPGYVQFQPGRDARYYIEQAGGLGELARDYDEISVIKAKTRRWMTVGENNVTIEPGDYIWVPKKTPRTFSFYLGRVSAISSVVGTIATIVLLLVQLGK